METVVNITAALAGTYSLAVAAKPQDADHPYGHGKAEFVSAALEGVLVMAAGCFMIYQSITAFVSNRQLERLSSGLVLVFICAAASVVMGYYCMRKGKQNRSLALIASGNHLITDAVTSFAILLGLAAVLLLKAPWIDKVLAIAMSGFIIYNGYRILRKSLSGIMDEADKDLLTNLVEGLNENRRINWIDLHNLRAIKYGSRLHIDCHLTVPWYLNVKEAHQEVEALNRLIDERYSSAVEMFVHTDGCLPTSCPICIKDDCPVRQSPFQKQLKWTLHNVVENRKHTI